MAGNVYSDIIKVRSEVLQGRGDPVGMDLLPDTALVATRRLVRDENAADDGQ